MASLTRSTLSGVRAENVDADDCVALIAKLRITCIIFKHTARTGLSA